MAPAIEMVAARLIKKYANRRLYDTVTSKHITLDGVHDLIRQGIDVKIVDEPSGEDISRQVLLQIIAEREQRGRPMLEADFLTRILRLYDNPMQDLVGEFLSKSFDSFLEQQTRYLDQLRSAMTTTPLETIQKLAAENMKLWQRMQEAMLPNDDGDDDQSK